MLLCHCHRVSDDAVAAVVSAGATRVGQVVRTTRAGTDCGSCIPQLRAACAQLRPRRDGDLASTA